MAITASEVNKLRQETGAGMMDCKKALTEANGDFDEAIQILRKKGQKVSAKRAGNATSEGSVFIATVKDGAEAILIALSCETDFVAKNEDFQTLGNAILKAAVAEEPKTIEELKALKLDDGRTAEEHITDMIGKLGEKLEIKAYEKIDGDVVVPYIHSNMKLGVVVALRGAKGEAVSEIGRDVAMQIAAMNPIAVDKDEVPQDVVNRELEVGRELALQEGKPENIVDKIAQGKLTKYYKDNTLLNQQFVKDSSKTVSQVLKEVNGDLTVSTFKRIEIA
jgi:elongation factor Ts